MIQLAESILEEDTTLGIAYLLALHEVCNGLSCKAVAVQNIKLPISQRKTFPTNNRICLEGVKKHAHLVKLPKAQCL